MTFGVCLSALQAKRKEEPPPPEEEEEEEPEEGSVDCSTVCLFKITVFVSRSAP